MKAQSIPEVYLIKRDGWARITEMRVGSRKIVIPAVISSQDPLFDLINFDLVPFSLKVLDEKKFEDLHSEDENFIVGTGLAFLSPSEVVKCLIELRGRSLVRPMVVTGIATPQNLPLLCYFGADIFDDSRALIAAHEGYYLLENGSFKLEKIKELPCPCPACDRVRDRFPDLKPDERTAFLKEHNVNKLKEQALLVRELIRSESLRNFVEARAKTSPELTVMLRKEGRFFERIHPRFKKSIVYMNTVESFRRPEVVLFLEKLPEIYRPKTKTALILPCTAKKPYSLSKTHRAILNGVGSLIKFVDEIVVSSPLVCPREFELTYPAQNYDTPVTGVWSGEEIEFVADKLSNLLGEFEVVIAHVEGGYRKVVERVVENLKPGNEISVIYTAENGVTSSRSLRNLRNALEEVKGKSRRKDRYMALFDSMFRYQFGLELKSFVENGKIRGRYPSLELFEAGKRILRVDSVYGMLDVDLPLAEKMIEGEIYLVEIDEFDPKGTIFAGGVLKADRQIRPNDIVFFRNSRFFGVGRALMSGEEMVEASKGAAIDVRRKASGEKG